MALPLGAIQVGIVGCISITLSIIALGLRLWSKMILGTSMAFHDWMVVAAMALTAGTVSVFLSAGFAAGLGLHMKEIMQKDPEMLALHLRLFVPAQLLWAAANTCVKFSILALYTTIFRGKRFAYICYATMAVTMAYFVSVFLETFLLCKPVQYSWDKSIKGECHGENLAYLVAGITNLAVDSFIVALPMPMLFGLQMSLPKKLGIAAMFSLGAVICVMSLLRVIWLHTWDLTDMTYTVTPGAIYSILEPTLGVVNACLPTIRPAVQKLSKGKALNWSNAYSKGTENIGSGGGSGGGGTIGSFGMQGRRKRFGGTIDTVEGSFDRLDDDIPLTTVQAGGTQQEQHPAPPHGIHITTQWQVGNSMSNGMDPISGRRGDVP